MEFNPNYKLRKGHEKEDLERLTNAIEALNARIRWIDGCTEVDVAVIDLLVHHPYCKWRDSYIGIQPVEGGEIKRIRFDEDDNLLKLTQANFEKQYLELILNEQIYCIVPKGKKSRRRKRVK